MGEGPEEWPSDALNRSFSTIFSFLLSFLAISFQFKERRKSLGIVLDGINNNIEFERLILMDNPQRWEHNSGHNVETLASSSTTSSTSHSSADNNGGRSNAGSLLNGCATGNEEIDDCLVHHLERAIGSMQVK
jgi:hypothetical protein